MNELLQQLFLEAGPNDPANSRSLIVLKKSGRPFLLLPTDPTKAVHALNLYPAQRPKAKLVRSLVRWGFRTRLPLPLEKTSLTLSLIDPFARFLEIQSGRKQVPAFAVLAGNPNTRGRRFAVLVFGRDEQPVVVVKAGAGPEAMELIQREKAFLKSVPRPIAGIPPVRGHFESPRLTAFALDFLEGDSPAGEDSRIIAEVLHSWIDSTTTIALNTMPAWVRLGEACGGFELYEKLDRRFADCSAHPAIHHGDFAPWNIKVSPRDGSWRVLDWERGELTGMPAWDWFHFSIQRKVLVSRLSALRIAGSMDDWLAAPVFQHYASTAGIEGVLHELLLAYLLYSIEITRPSEGLQTTRDLLNVLAQQWQIG